ncbi:MAG: AzlC family ABC transporter permease [Anaerolineae bacterium]|nr:AzlC family ABC transporter permease [Anaerolineae bacterium]
MRDSVTDRDLARGVRDTLPLLVGVAPFGLVFGLLGRTTALGPAGTLAMSAFVFAGSAQFISLSLLGAGTAYPLIVLTTLVVNLRHALYAASLLPYVRHLSAWWRRFLAFGLTDESYAVVITHYRREMGTSAGDNDPPEEAARGYRRYFLAANLTMYICWQLSTAAGVLLGGSVPDPTAWGLDFALPVIFIALLAGQTWDRASVITALVSGAVALVARDMPGKLGLLLAALLATTIGWGVDVWQKRR